MSDTKLKPMGAEFLGVADAMMDFRAAGEAFDDARAKLKAAVMAATPVMVAEGLNVFNRGPLLFSINEAKGLAGAEAAHFEADRLRRLMGYAKPPENQERGGGGGGGR